MKKSIIEYPNQKNINSLFIPFKYKIKAKVDISTVFRKIPERHSLAESKKDIFNNLLHKLNSGNLSEKDNKRIYSAAYSSLLNILKQEKKKILKNNYSEDAIISSNWIELYQSLNSPLYAFQDIYFQYIHSKIFVDLFGEDVYEMIEEILRDDFITKNEKEYLLEKAEEFGISNSKLSSILDEYFHFNPAIKKLLYEICKDGVITEAEKQYVIEKANQYQITKDRIIEEIELIVKTICKINELFKNPEFYELVLLIFIVKFIDPLNKDIVNKILGNINSLILGKEQAIQLNKNDILNNVIILFNSYSKIRILNKKSSTLNSIIDNLGLNIIQHYKIVNKYCEKVHVNYSAESMIEVINTYSGISPNFIENNDYFQFGGENYQLNYVEDTNAPLFCFDTIGNQTIISINRSHYFYQDIVQLKIGILSMVINLKKNYASEELIEEVQHILNPPARIRLKFPKES